MKFSKIKATLAAGLILTTGGVLADDKINTMANKIGLTKVSECLLASISVKATLLANPEIFPKKEDNENYPIVADLLVNKFNAMGVSLVGRQEFIQHHQQLYSATKYREPVQWLRIFEECMILYAKLDGGK